VSAKGTLSFREQKQPLFEQISDAAECSRSVAESNCLIEQQNRRDSVNAVPPALLQKTFVVNGNVLTFFKSIQIIFPTAASHSVILWKLAQNCNQFLNCGLSDVIATPFSEVFQNVDNYI
jgi:hypothetical protein